MTFMVTFKVYGQPQGKARPRFTRAGRAYTPKKTMLYEEEVRMMAKAAMGSSDPLETPVMAYVYITFPVPPSYSKTRKQLCLDNIERPAKKPDADNVAKAILDSINDVVYMDDAQVVDLHVTKRYGDIPMVEVLIKEALP